MFHLYHTSHRHKLGNFYVRKKGVMANIEKDLFGVIGVDWLVGKLSGAAEKGLEANWNCQAAIYGIGAPSSAVYDNFRGEFHAAVST